jgi:MBG domain (YGX type)/Bacterial Ig-like domain (group 3)/NHL repeat/Abnormal spindle-like microcephaly-assoc'd, ASPM-SPD-2-Hydin
MRPPRPSGVRAIVNLVCFVAATLAPTFACSQALTPAQSGTRYAGTITPGFNGDFGSATTVSLNTPSYIVFDSHGNQYISDTQNNCVRKIDTSGSMSTLVGLAVSGTGDTCSTASNSSPTPAQGLYQPTGLAVDSSNNLYIADTKHNCVRVLNNGFAGVRTLTTVAGTCGSAASPTPSPNGLVLDANNNLYISIQDTETLPAVSTNQVLRQAPGASLCVMAGATSTLVPNACVGITGSVVLNAPSGLAINGMGDLFIADTGNNCVRQIANLATYKTAVGQCANDASGNSATALNKPYGLTFSPTQSLFITETSPDNLVSYIPGSSSLTIAAGLPNGASGPYSPTQDGTSAIGTPLNAPRGITVDSLGNFSLADSGNSIARKLSGNVIFPSTPVGSASATMPITFVVNQNVNLSVSSGPDFSITSNTCSGPLSPASPGSSPYTCQVFVRFTPTRPGLRSAPITLTDSISGKIILQGLQAVATGSLSVFTPGTVNTLAGPLASPAAVVVDSTGNAYFLEAGTTSGTADLLMLPAGGGSPQIVIPQGAGLLTPSALAIDSAGNFFIADANHGTVARFGADGTINTSYVTGLDTPTAIYADGFDNLFIAQAGATHNVIEVYTAESRRVISSNFVSPSGLFLDLNGILYIADAGAHYVYAVDKSGILHEVAGNGTTTTSVLGQATGTALLAPSSLSVDAAGDLYIADAAANRVYTVFASTTSSGSNMSTVFGTGTAGSIGDGGFANIAEINNPISVAVDGSSNLFVIDKGSNSVREITYPAPAIAFGTVMVGQSSPTMQQKLSNFGTDNLNLTAPFSTSDSHFTVDSNSTTCGTTIIAGSTCNLGFVFTPTSNGPLSATVTLVSNSYNSPQPIQLAGTGKLIAPLQFTLPPQTEVYGQPFPETVLVSNGSPAPTGTITFSLGKEVLCTLTATLTSTTTCNAPSTGLSVGTYTVIFSYSGDSNYASANSTVTLTVTPATLTVTANNASRGYGAANPIFSGTTSGLVNGDTVTTTFATTAVTNSPIGNYPIVPTVSGASSNYTVVTVNGTLTITQNLSSLVVSVDSKARAYGAANPNFTGTVSGVLPGDNVVVTYTSTATPSSPAGNYPIGANVSGTSASNYIATIHPGTLAITPVSTVTTITTSGSPATVGANVTFTATVTTTTGVVAGTVNFSDGATLLGTATLNSSGVGTFSTTALGLGSHSITGAFQANTNFNASSATLTQVMTAPTGSFTISASPATQYIKGAGPTVFQVTLTSVGAFAGQINLTCSGLPSDAACSFANNPTLTAGGTATVAMTVTTTAADAELRKPLPRSFTPADFAPITAAAVFPVELTGLGVFFVGLRRGKKLGTQKMHLLAVLIFSLAILGLTGCGCPSTTFQSYTISINATSATFIAPAQSTSVILSVGNQ